MPGRGRQQVLQFPKVMMGRLAFPTKQLVHLTGSSGAEAAQGAKGSHPGKRKTFCQRKGDKTIGSPTLFQAIIANGTIETVPRLASSSPEPAH